MKNNTGYLYLLLGILLISCTKNINSPIIHFDGKPAEKIYPSKIVDLEEFGILRPFEFLQIDDSNFVIQDLKDENIFNLINLSSKKVIRGVNKGQGPNDILVGVGLQYRDNKILTYDAFLKKMNEIVLLSDTTLGIKEVYRIKTEVVMLYMVYQLDSTFIATGQFGDYWLAEMNKDGEILSTIDFPLWEETKDIRKLSRPSLFFAKMAKSPDNKRIVVVARNQGVISFLNRTDSGIEEYKQIKYHPPKFTITERSSAYSRDNVEGFCAVDCDNNYVYAIYSNRTYNSHQLLSSYCEHLFVYDWDGNPVKRYILDIPINRISYDKEKNSIYGFSNNPEGVLIEYKL